MTDPVNSPSHYNINGIEVIDVIETYVKNDYRLGNVIKYVCRHQYKGKPLEDLKKARWYLDRVIGEMEVTGIEPDYQECPNDIENRIAGDSQASRRLKHQYYFKKGVGARVRVKDDGPVAWRGETGTIVGRAETFYDWLVDMDVGKGEGAWSDGKRVAFFASELEVVE